MSRLSRDYLSLVDHAQVLLLSGFASGVSDPASQTSAALTITFTTDNPAITPDGSITIADGDSLTNLNQYEMAEETKDQINKLVADVTATRAAVASLIGSNVFTVSAPAAFTSKTPAAATALHTFTYTTDAPAFTLNGAVTIADGDLTTAAEYHEYIREASRTMVLIRNDLGALHRVASQIIGQRSFQGISALAAITAAAITVTYTTDNPAITPGNSTTIADGDGNITAAERNDLIAEFNDELTKLIADVTAIRTALAAWLAVAGIS